MSDYTKLTNFAVKDGYVSGTPAKVIKGTELDDEFNAIATAVATKFDSTDGVNIVAAINTTAVTNATNATKLITTNYTVEQVGSDLIFKKDGSTIAALSATSGFTIY